MDRDFSSITWDLMRFHGVFNARTDDNDRHNYVIDIVIWVMKIPHVGIDTMICK